MANTNDGGLVAFLAQWVIDTLKALKLDDVDVFKTVDLWKHQVGVTESGMEASGRYSPFAFVSCGDEDTAREGGNDLRRIPDIRILIGVDSKLDGDALWGNADKPGTSKIRDLIIAALDKKQPDDENITCDEFYYIRAVEILDQPKRHWVRMDFEVSQMST